MPDVIENLPNGDVRIRFNLGEEPFVLYDAITLPPDIYADLGPNGIEAEKQQRYDNWIAIVNPPEG